jgi:hypothetical protein
MTSYTATKMFTEKLLRDEYNRKSQVGLQYHRGITSVNAQPEVASIHSSIEVYISTTTDFRPHEYSA